MKTKRNDYELLLETLSRLQEEKTNQSLLNESLRKELAALRESHAQEMAALRENFALSMETMRRTIDELNRAISEQSRINADLAAQLANAQAGGKLARGKRFAPTTEQRDLLNNRSTDRRARDKDDFDGTPPSAPADNADQPSSQPRKKKKSQGRKPAKEDYGCDEVRCHLLGEYFTLPPGGRFKTRNGEVETHIYEYYEYVPGHVVLHQYETATYIDAMGDSHNTYPAAERSNPVNGCPFSPEMLAFILTEKYAYHTPKNRIKIKLREMGVRFSKTTFNRHCQLAERMLKDAFGKILHSATMESNYLMIDETCELVGVSDDNGAVRYLKRYLWAFYNKGANLVSYLYEQGSRAREVVLKALQGFTGTFSSDGYTAYVAFDGNDHPEILHCGCWAHARRYVIEAMGVAYNTSRTLLDEIETLFMNERQFNGMDATERKTRRQRQSLPVLNRIFTMVERIAADTAEMGKDLLRKAVNYIRKQRETLRNFIFDGNAEISNNLVEQRMKPIKLSLKNCQNIGSEGAAQNAAFMHSIIESCRLNGKNPYQYLLTLFRKARETLDAAAKRALMPDRWVPDC